MPTVSVKRDLLFQALGRTYSECRPIACASPRRLRLLSEGASWQCSRGLAPLGIRRSGWVGPAGAAAWTDGTSEAVSPGLPFLTHTSPARRVILPAFSAGAPAPWCRGTPGSAAPLASLVWLSESRKRETRGRSRGAAEVRAAGLTASAFVLFCFSIY